MSIPAIPQVTIYLDLSGKLRAEAPGSNGTRRKIDLPIDFSTTDSVVALESRIKPLVYYVIEELQSQANAIKAQRRADTLTLQRNNIDYVSTNHCNLAEKIWDSHLIFKRSLRRNQTNLGTTELDLSPYL